MHLSYTVTYEDFLASMKAYRKRSGRVAIASYVHLWLLPVLGAFLVLFYFYFYFAEGRESAAGISYAPWVGLAFIIGGPLLRMLGMHQLYKQRTALAVDGAISAELDESTVRFIIAGKIDVKYSWDAFSDYSESDDVVTLFVQKAAFHTIPRHGMSDVQWIEFMQLVETHVRKR